MVDKSIVCLNNISGNKYQMVDCETGEALALGKSGVRKKRAPSAYNICVKEAFKNKGAKNLKEAAGMCKRR